MRIFQILAATLNRTRKWHMEDVELFISIKQLAKQSCRNKHKGNMS